MNRLFISFFRATLLAILMLSALESWAAIAPVITSTGIVSGTAGTAFSYQITGTNSPISFSVTGTLPAGLSLNTATITGTPTTAGVATVTINATNAGGTGTASLKITINPAKPVITSAVSASGITGSAFNYKITGTNSPTSFAVTGTLPAGLSLNTLTGSISGTPTIAGTTNVTMSATNISGTATASLQITITLAKPAITSASSVSSTVRSAFSYTIIATNNPTSFGVTGTLPVGLSFNAQTGVISGTPGTAGTTNVTMSAVNAGGTATAALQITIQAPAGKKLINVQGKITDTAGNPLTSSVVVTFRLYANLNDPVANAVWSENQLVAPQNGLFNMTLGNVTALDSVPFNNPYYLGMQVSGDNNELQPRQLLGASAYALGSLGDFNVQGNEVVGGSMSAGNISANGNFLATGNISANGTLSVNGKDVGANLVPQNAIMMFAGTCPAGWTRFSALDNAFPLGSSAYGSTGGSATATHNHSISTDGSHSHGTPNHTHTLATISANGLGCNQPPGPVALVIQSGNSLAEGAMPGRNSCVYGNSPVLQMNTINGGGGQTDTQGAHNHGGVTGDATTSIMPPYVTVVWCQKQ